jgi:Lrp/AsnC family leucine-responsive transcriptional regulator
LIRINLASHSKFVDPQVFCKFHREYRVWRIKHLFYAAVQAWPEVVECAALTGEMDYLLRVVVEDMAHYSRFIMETLLKHPSVEDCKTSFVLDRVKNTTAVPV